ncbi:XIAP-associated factor 1-like, partial [Brachionus plicatilis]
KENCSKRQVECQYCDLSLDSDKIDGHLVVCGSRTELCEKCRKYVLLRDKFAHELSNCLNREKTPRKSAGQRKQELINASRPSSSLTAFPCEFCNKQFIGFQQLIEHQVFCDLNCSDNEPSGILSNFTYPLDQDLEEMSLNPRGNEIFDEVDKQSDFSLVPCEFCDEYIDFNVFNEHLKRCKSILPSRNEGTSNPESGKSNNAKKVASFPKTGAQAQASNQTSNKRFSENTRAPRILPRVIPSRNLASKSSKDILIKTKHISKENIIFGTWEVILETPISEFCIYSTNFRILARSKKDKSELKIKK